MSNPESSKSGPSAEAIVAVVLLAVCVVVGIAYWLLSPKSPPASAGATSTPGAAAGSSKTAGQTAAEQDALNAWNHKLQNNFAELDQQRQQSAEREAEQKRQEQELAAAEAARKAAEEAAAKAAKAAAAKASSVEAAAAPPPASAAPATHVPQRVDASVDWTSCRQPDYPSRSKDRGEQGTVTLRFALSVSGAVQSSSVVNSSGFSRLDDAALHALTRCQFKPITVDGKPVAGSTDVRFQWKLNGF
ncbi:energy transducer TonB [Solimonas terrae]|uniref:Energy transducer TonB n=1 Tax=Solimonas terrae TaxID=1396819 RepID=A0A6M2BXH3_9GAMM|nr:energy transducer TonB [Solimonas terrae]NGY07020.1 energy transducer TonB [Solimonas terrae]